MERPTTAAVTHLGQPASCVDWSGRFDKDSKLIDVKCSLRSPWRCTNCCRVLHPRDSSPSVLVKTILFSLQPLARGVSVRNLVPCAGCWSASRHVWQTETCTKSSCPALTGRVTGDGDFAVSRLKLRLDRDADGQAAGCGRRGTSLLAAGKAALAPEGIFGDEVFSVRSFVRQ